MLIINNEFFRITIINRLDIFKLYEKKTLINLYFIFIIILIYLNVRFYGGTNLLSLIIGEIFR